MARCLKSDQNARRNVVAEHPIPHWRSTGLVVGLSEDVFRTVESVRLGDRDWKPDDIQQEIEYDDIRSCSEDPLVRLRVQVIHADADAKKAFRDDPLHSSEADVVGVSWEVEPEDSDLRKQEIGRGL